MTAQIKVSPLPLCNVTQTNFLLRVPGSGFDDYTYLPRGKRMHALSRFKITDVVKFHSFFDQYASNSIFYQFVDV